MSSLGRAAGTALIMLVPACYDSMTAPTDDLITTPNDLVAVVTRITYDDGFAPAGFQLDQYEFLVAIPPATQAEGAPAYGVNQVILLH